MISLSDNTATDQLLFILGREKVEAVAPQRVRPFLSTLELLKLKWTAGGRRGREYAAASRKRKREILAELAAVPKTDIALTREPTLIREVEWLITTRELCRVIRELKDLPVLAINPGLADKANWRLAGFKGGSEAGVLNFTHVLRKTKSSPVYAVSATWNDPDKEVDRPAFTELVTRLITLLEKGKL
jgi:hypothetical protein